MLGSSINKETDVSFDENDINDENDKDVILETLRNNSLSSVKSYLSINNNSTLSAVLNICSSAIGAGCLSLPHCLDSAGIFNSFIVFIFIAGCIYYSLELLRSFLVDTKYSSFSVMTETVLGKKWLIVYSLTSFLCYFSVNINYMIVNYSIFRKIYSNSGWERYVFGILFLLVTYVIEIILCLFTRKINKIYILSLIVIIVFFIFIIILIIGGFDGFSTEKFSFEKFFNPFNGKKPYEILFEIISTSITYIYTFAYHSTYPTFLSNVSPDQKTSKKVNLISFGIICISYIIISFFGYLFKKEVPEVLFLKEVEDSDKNFINIFIQIMVFIMLFSLIPFRHITIRDGYKGLISKEKFNNRIDLILTAVFLFIANLIVFIDAEIFEDGTHDYKILEIFINILGGFLGVILCFLLPVINFAAINGKTKIKSIIGYIISIFFIIVVIISAYYSIYKFINSKI